MSSGTSPESSSPRASSNKVQTGRVEKSKVKKESKQPTYRIGGRTFACEACKKGHRVSKCTHASERPVSMTNDPGRPSGDQKRHCDCPRQCSCTKKNCKCDRNCSCTQRMYMLVYVPIKDGEKAKEGEWKIGQEVITDLQGKKLSEEEIKARNELKQLQQMSKGAAPLSDMLKASPAASDTGSPPKSCCKHKKNIEEKRKPLSAPKESTETQRRPQCNCGAGCTCAFCLDHPNNQTSHLLAQQQAAYFSSQSYGQQQMYPSWEPPQVGGSCMGTNPRFAVSSTPNPSQSQFQTLFPAAGPASQGGYFISYPFTRFSGYIQPAFDVPMHSPMVEKPIVDAPVTPYTSSESMTPIPQFPQSTSSCCHTSAEADLPPIQEPDPSFENAFDLTSYDIGDAVASGWNGFDDFAYGPAFDEQIHPFQPSEGPPTWDLSGIDLIPTLASPPPIHDTVGTAYASPNRPATAGPSSFSSLPVNLSPPRHLISTPAALNGSPPPHQSCQHHHGAVQQDPHALQHNPQHHHHHDHQSFHTENNAVLDFPTPSRHDSAPMLMHGVYAHSPV